MKILNNYKQEIDGTVILTREDVETISMALTLALPHNKDNLTLGVLEAQFRALQEPMRAFHEPEGHHEGDF